MKFKDWLLKEVGTSTSCIAGFSRMALPMSRRMWPIEVEEKDKKKKKPKKDE